MSELPVNESSQSSSQLSSPMTSDSADSNQMKIVEPINNTDITGPTSIPMPIINNNNNNNSDNIVNNITSNNCLSAPELMEPSVNNEDEEMEDLENNNESNDGANHESLTIIREDMSLEDKRRGEGRKRNIAELMEEPVIGTIESHQQQKRPMTNQVDHDRRKEKDDYCWNCHKDKSNISCNSCPRSFHTKCLPPESPNPGTESNDGVKSCKSWVCPECTCIMKSEDLTTRSSVLSHLNPHEFAELLMFAVQTIKTSADRSFHQPVSESVFPDYRNYVVYPMDFSTIEKNIRAKIYGCTEAFMADIKYIVHNCYIYNSPNHPLTKNANYFLKVARNEMQEIEICPNCFRNFYTIEEKKWFIEPCARPHILVYAKMRGYPPWPAKVVRYDKEKNEVDVRFFGAHDRSWIPADSCHLLSKPNFTKVKASGKGQKNKIDVALNELEQHINRLNELFPFKFHYAKSKEPINVNKLFICDGNSDEEISPLDDDRDSDLNEDKLVIDETGDDLDGIANEAVESKTEIETPTKTVPEAQIKNEIPKLTIPKSVKTPLRSPAIPPTQAITPSSPDKDDVKKPVKKKGKNKKSKEKLENDVVNPNSTKKSELKKKISIKALEEEPSKKSEEFEQLKRKLDFDKLMHKEQIREMEHNHNLLIREMRESWVKEKERALNELEEKHKKEVEEIKKKQWCSECLKEAMYFCCWNTSYCSHNCQKAHWPKHALKCQQQQHNRQAQSTTTTTTTTTQQPAAATPTPTSQATSQPSAIDTTSQNNSSIRV